MSPPRAPGCLPGRIAVPRWAWAAAWLLALATLLTAVLATLMATRPPTPASTEAAAGSAPLRLTNAERRCGGAAVQQVTLPDRPAPAAPGPLLCSYRLADLRPGSAQGLFIPGLAAHARIRLNGVVLRDTLAAMPALPPRSVDRIVLLAIPDTAWQPAGNLLQIDAAGPATLALSSLVLGPQLQLAALQRARVLGLLVGPGLVAAVMGTLGLCMLLLWHQQHDAMHGYFGAATLGWAAHNLWSVLPWRLLPQVPNAVAWTWLYTFFVAMLVIFCVRFADWHWPRFERGVWVLVLATPLVLSAATVVGQLALADGLWRLLLVALATVGVVAVARASLRRPSIDLVLVAASGAVGLALGVHDWWLNLTDAGDNPVYLVPYAGLPFALLVVRLLITRVTQASQQLAHMNTALAQQVALQTSALQTAMDAMRQARDAAEAADQAKTRFLAAASHDLRQPAHALALYMAALRAQPLDSRQADLVQRMSGSLSALETMFNLLLDMSRIDAGALAPAPRAFDAAQLLRRLADEMAPEMEARGLRLALHLPRPATAGGAEALAFSDPVLVERILRNLLANAAKYTVQGGVLLACRQRRAPAGGRHWRIEVWDTGLGIASEHRERIFEAFFQIDNPGRNRALGLGLGLSIVQRLVQLLGLPLTVHSQPGRGSCFMLGLPLTPAGRAGAHLPSLPAQLPTGAPPTAVAGMVVALIEDDDDVCAAMQALLHSWGCTLAHGADADALAAHWPGTTARPDALLVDHRLQAGHTGPAEAERLFARWQARVPMLLVTGESDLQALRAAGHSCLAKPVAPALLAHWLAAVRQRGQPLRQQARP